MEPAFADFDDVDFGRTPPRGNTSKPSSSLSWNSRMGPEKGVKFRGGAPPTPPTWRYSREDLRSYVKWERKLSIWKLQVASYMTRREAALLLFTSLSGEAEEEQENCDLEQVNSANGIEYIQEQLRCGLETKMVYQKRKLLADHETIVRQNNESIRAFANRYRRTERALASVGVNVEGMYDDEARGNRLLERSRLSPENQRLALIGSRYNLSFDAILESMCMSFPEHKPAPPLFGKDGMPIRTMPKTPSTTTSLSSMSSSSSTAASSYRSDRYDKGKGKGKFKPRQAFASEHQELDAVPEDNEVGDENDEAVETEDQEAPPDGDDDGQDGEGEDEELDLGGVAEVLTVTAKKLQSMTLGRKFSGSRSISDRKKSSHCSACGELGHWAGDAACSKSAKGGGKSKSKGSTFGGNDPSKSQPAKKVLFTLNCDDAVEHHLPQEPLETPPFFTFMVNTLHSHGDLHQVMFMGSDLAGLMVLDTACQRTCCGTEWMSKHVGMLSQFRLHPHSVPTSEAFQFGRGQPITARCRVYLPAVIGGVHMLLGASVVDTPIPLLASNTLLELLDTVIDLGHQRVLFRAIGVETDIIKVQGHLAVSISAFSEDACGLRIWKTLSAPRFWINPHPEIIIPGVFEHEAIRAQEQISGVFTVQDADEPSTNMAEEVEAVRADTLQNGIRDSSLDESHGHLRTGQTSLDGLDGCGLQPRQGATAVEDEEGPSDVHRCLQSSGVETVWQQDRVLRKLRPVSSEDKMGHRPRAMRGNWKAIISKIFFACAILFKYLSGTSQDDYQQVQEQAPSIFSSSFEQH